MSIRIIARVRPQHKSELYRDSIVTTTSSGGSSFVKVPNPKNENEVFSFQFSGVYDHSATQQEIFEQEISPTIKHLFQGFDVTIFAYGSTGTGKTHTMCGGKSLADRGVIPRLLSGVYRRARKTMKDSEGASSVRIFLSYFEIYNDKVFDLFESPEKRCGAGLPLRDNGGKTVVVGLTERPCDNLKEFERLYNEANINRSTSATKLNACSSRSHAILRLKLSVTTGDQVTISAASAIDLAGSEDNRRTENGKERMIESASINKSLFTLAKCVEAISRGDERIPYRESKMTRILSLGQNNGFTIMILNLAPLKSYHLDTLSSLNFANRTKKVEIREVENEPIFKGCTRSVQTCGGPTSQRQPLRPLASTMNNANVLGGDTTTKKAGKQSKAFSVYSDKTGWLNAAGRTLQPVVTKRSPPLKRRSDHSTSSVSRPAKRAIHIGKSQPAMSKRAIEDMIERKVTDIFAAKALDQPSIAPQPEIGEEVQRRLDMLEKKIEGRPDGREEGLTFLLMAKQHAVRGENTSALRMYTLAKEFFPCNKKLDTRIEKLREKIEQKKLDNSKTKDTSTKFSPLARTMSRHRNDDAVDKDDVTPNKEHPFKLGDSICLETKCKERRSLPVEGNIEERTPRTRHLLDIVNTRDMRQIRMLRGVGEKKAEAIVMALIARDNESSGPNRDVTSLRELSSLRGIGSKTIETIRARF